jgi:ATP-binding cassette subfamily B protein
MRAKKNIITLLILTVATAAIESSYPLFTKYAVDNFIAKGTTDGLAPFSVLYLVVVTAIASSVVLWAVNGFAVEYRVSQSIRRAEFIRLQELSIDYYSKNSVGYLIGRFMSDTGRVSEFLAWGLLNSSYILMFSMFSVVYMFTISWKLAVIAIAVIPVTVIVTALLQPLNLKLNRRSRELNSRITGAINEGVTGAKTAKTLVAEGKFTGEFRELTKKFFTASRRVSLLGAIVMPTVTLVGSVAVGAILYRGGYLVGEGLMKYGALSAFITYTAMIVDPISDVASQYSEMLGAQTALERVFRLIDAEVSVSDKPEVVEKYGGAFDLKRENWEPITGDVEFRNVSFKYPGSETYILRDFNLAVPAGSSVAIVGETGAGKSTIVNLVCRFYEPTDGELLIDGADYRERSVAWLRSSLGYVLQDPHLFSGTIRENIRYGKLDASDEETETAARFVSADVVAARCAKGLDTEVGEGGAQLSTGEKQLVSFARAIIARPALFVLDEATSSIDTETERLIQNATDTILAGRTSFIIAHRLSTITRCDMILVVDGGEIVERGTHAQLMAQNGHYRELFNAMRIDEAAV